MLSDSPSQPRRAVTMVPLCSGGDRGSQRLNVQAHRAGVQTQSSPDSQSLLLCREYKTSECCADTQAGLVVQMSIKH